MKRLSDNIRFVFLAILWGLCFLSCSDEVGEMNHAEVVFTATFPDEIHARSFGDGLKVNTLVVGVFDETQTEIERKEFSVSVPTVNVQLALAKEQTYHFVFWAYNDDCGIYDIDNLNAIVMRSQIATVATFEQTEKSDAFFATVRNFKVTEHTMQKVELVRPLAQINVGRVGEGANSAFIVKSVPDTFHPFTETVSGAADFNWTFDKATTETFVVDKTAYTYLAIGYVFAPSDRVMKKDCELVLTDENGQKTYERNFPQVVLRARHRSNILGSFTNTNE